MNRKKTEQRRWIQAIALAALVLPVLLGTVPGLHHHELAGSDTDLPTAGEAGGGGNDCPFCALSRVPLQVVTADAGDSPSLEPVAMPAQVSDTPAQDLQASDAPPRAPPL